MGGGHGRRTEPRPVRPHRRFVRTALAALLVALVLGLLAVGLTARLFVWPESSSPTSADAVIVLSGDYGERLARGLALVHAGVSSTLVLDGEPDSQQVLDLCKGGQAFEVICLRPRPDSTRYEARAAAQLAADRNWSKVAVVTSTAHLTRAGVLFRRCLKGSVVMVEGRLRPTVRFLVHEWLGLGDAVVLARSC